MALPNTAANPIMAPIPWDRLRSWIDEQEALERNNPGGGGVSIVQREALSLCVPFAQDSPHLEPDDFISRLILCLQSKRIDPNSNNLTWEDTAVTIPIHGNLVPRYRTVCKLRYCGAEVPCEGFGLHEDGSLALFESKKRAKQYAAKAALMFITSRDLSKPPPAAPEPEAGQAHLEYFAMEVDRPLSTSAPQPKRPRFNSAAGMSVAPSPNVARVLDLTVANLRSLSTANTRPSNSDVKNGQPQGSEHRQPQGSSSISVFDQVDRLCKLLDLPPVAYRTEPDPLNQHAFSGRPVFGSFTKGPSSYHGPRPPTNLGNVSGAPGKEEARERVAECVRDWLQMEEQKQQHLLSYQLMLRLENPDLGPR